MKQSIVLLSFLLVVLFSCTGSTGSDSGLTTLKMASLDTLTTFLRNHGGLKSDESLEHYNITVTPKTPNSQCSSKQTSSDQQSQSSTTTTTNPGNFTLQTGDNESCAYDLSATYTSNKSSIFNGTTTIGKGLDNPYTSGDTIDVKVTLIKKGTTTQIQTAIGTSTTTGTKKDVNMTICYDGKCDGNTTTTTGTRTCEQRIEAQKNSMKTGNNQYFIFCYPQAKCTAQQIGPYNVHALDGCNSTTLTYIVLYNPYNTGLQSETCLTLQQWTFNTAPSVATINQKVKDFQDQCGD